LRRKKGTGKKNPPWVTLGMLSVDATKKLGDQSYIYLGIGVISVLLSLLGIYQKKSQTTINGILGIVAVGFLKSLLRTRIVG